MPYLFVPLCCLFLLELSSVRSGKKSPNQETGLGNREQMKVLNDTKLILMIKGYTHAHLGIRHYSEPSYGPYSPNQFLGWDFFAASYSAPKNLQFSRLICKTK